MSVIRKLSMVGAVLFLLSGTVQAQASRTWVSGVGDDANPCSRTAPCKTFAGAISKTAAGGEIDVLDPGGFGAVTITKSISLVSDGNVGSILAAGTNGIVVAAGADDVVVIRGLGFEGINGIGLSGIRFTSGKALHIEHCTINGFGASSSPAVNFAPAASGSELFMKDVVVRNNHWAGVSVQPGAGADATVSLDDVTLDHNEYGLIVTGKSTVTVRNSLVSGNTWFGISSVAGEAQLQVTVDGSSLVNNNGSAIRSQGANSTVRISGCTITGNVQGLRSVAGGNIVSFGNNVITANGSNPTPTGTESLM